MKHLAFFLLLVGFSNRGGTQPLQAFAGVDTVWCSEVAQTGPRLGGNPAATGGSSPYSYLWRYLGGGPASFAVDSPATARPRFNSPNFADSTDLVLEVSDAANAVARDTVRVYRTRHLAVTVDCRFEKSAGDTVQLWATGLSQFAPYSFQWSPAFALSSVTTAATRSWAPVNTIYTLTTTDRMGCPAYHVCKVFVWPTQAADVEPTARFVRILPSPATPDSYIEISPDLIGSELRMFSTDGKLLCIRTLHSVTTPVKQLLSKTTTNVLLYRV